MGIEIRNLKGIFAPVVCCDSCGELIKTGRGAVIHDMSNDVDRPIFVHKGSCLDFELDSRREGGAPIGWAEFHKFFADLLGNVGFDFGKAEHDSLMGTVYVDNPLFRPKKRPRLGGH